MNIKHLSAGKKATGLFLLVAAFLAVISFSDLFNTKAQRPIGKLVPLGGTISGRVFQDFNGNGLYDTSGGTDAVPTAIDVGVAGVTVSAYDSAGVLRGTATTAATGLYSITATGTGPYRVEFTTIPAGYSLSARS